jgi:type II secretory pathway component PulF
MSHPIKPAEKIIATLVLFLVIGFYSSVLYVTPEFKNLFQDIGVNIPRSTQFVIDTYLYWLVFPIAGSGGYALIIWYGNRRGWYLLAAAILSAAVFLPIMTWAMYQPVVR